jgi:hypothetical protein
MSYALGKLKVIMFQFIVGGLQLRLLMNRVSKSLAIGLTFGIFMSKMGRFHGPCEYFLCEFPLTLLSSMHSKL